MFKTKFLKTSGYSARTFHLDLNEDFNLKFFQPSEKIRLHIVSEICLPLLTDLVTIVPYKNRLNIVSIVFGVAFK